MSDDMISANPATNAALQLDGDPRQVRDYYETWASEYDDDMRDVDYSGPSMAARLAQRYRADTSAKILDAGCGTGLVGIELAALGYRVIDGFDLSESMAARARATGCYREIRGGIDMMRAAERYPGAAYDVVLSIGVFTLGHVPPEALECLLALSRPRGLLLVSTRTQYYAQTRFQERIDGLCTAQRLRVLTAVMDAPYNKDGDAHYWVLEKSA